jgi:hypothetical protein
LIGRYSWLACYLFSRVPVLCTHYLGVVHKKGLRGSARP